MILFDWHKIYRASGGKSSEIIRIFEMLAKREIPKNHRDSLTKYSNINFSGDSFLINEVLLLQHMHKFTAKEVAVYIALASRRRLADYYALRKLTLGILEANVNPELYKHNRLLYVKDGEINFIIENIRPRKIKNGTIV